MSRRFLQLVSFVLLASLFLTTGARAQRTSLEEGAQVDVPLTRPTAISCGDQLTRQITRPGTTQLFSFRGQPGETVDLALNELAGFDDSFVEASVTTAAGEPLGVLIGTELESFLLPQLGRYHIAVSAAATGTFSLTLGCPDAAVAMACGDGPTSGTLDDAGELDYYRFTAQPGDFVQLVLVETGGFPGSAPRATLCAPSGTRVATVDADNGYPVVLQEAGDYTVQVRANDLEGEGSYNIGIGCVPPPTSILLECGELPISSSTGNPGELTYFTFDGGAEDTIDIVIVGPDTVLPQAVVYSPLGLEIATFTSNSLQGLTLAEPGLYTIEVQSASLAQAGAFSIAVACRNPLGPATTLTCGSLVNDALTIAEVDYFTFPVGAGQSLDTGDVAELTLTETSGFPGLAAPQLRVFTPSGMDLGAFTADSSNPITLTETGDYAIRVNSNALLESGTYQISLACLAPSTVVHIGDDSLATDAISMPAELDLFSFDGDLGEIVELTLVQTSGFSGTFAAADLIAPSGAIEGSFTANNLVAFSLLEQGRYRVRIGAANVAGTGTYNVGLERLLAANGDPDPDPVSPPLACGQVIAASIDQSGEVDYYRFSGATGDVVDLTLVETSGFTGGNAPLATLISPSGTTLDTFLSDALREQVLPETGQYSIRVTANTLVATGTYNIGFFCRAPLGPVVRRLVCGDVVQTQIATSGELDYFTFEGTAGDAVDITLVEVGGFPGGSLPHATVFTPSGAVLDTFDSDALEDYDLPETGQYTIRIRSNLLFYTGTYNIGFFCRTPLGPIVDSLTCGQVVQTQIANSGELDYFTFAGTAGDAVDITLVEVGGFTGGSLPHATVFTPSGTVLDTFDSDALQGYDLPETGQYTIRIRSNLLFYTGTYNLGFFCRAPLGPVVQNLVCGDVAQSNVSASGELDYFTFDGTAGDAVDITLVEVGGFTGGSLPHATVFTPSGTVLDTFDSDALQGYDLPETGQYTIRIRSNLLFYTGTYNLGFFCRAPLGPVVQNLVCGDVVQSNISASGELDYFTFDGTAGDTVDLTLVETGDFPGGSLPCLDVYAPDGSLVDSFCSTSLRSYVLSDSGLYTIRIRSNLLFYVGPYSLGFFCRAPLGPVVQNLACGDVVQSNISASGELDYFTFDGTAGDTVDLTLVETGDFPGGSLPCLDVYAPDGSLVDSFCSTSLRSYVLSDSGLYTIRIRSNLLFYVGPYSLGFFCRAPLGPVVDDLTCGEVVQGSLSVSGEMDYFTFDGVTGQTIDLTLVEAGGFPGGSLPCLDLYAPDGSLVDSFCATSLMTYVLPESGQYTVRVRSNLLYYTGTYSLGLSCL